MHAAYPPRALETIQLEDLVPVVEMRPDKLLLEEKSGVKRPDSSLFLQKLQNELTAQKATLSFETTIQLGQFIQQNQAFAEEVERFNQRNAREAAQDQAKAAMLQACALVRALLKNFFKWLQYQHNPTTSPEGYRIAPSYREKFCNAEMNLAKFLYGEITNPRTHPDYQDIEVVLEIQRVRSEARDAEFKPNSINPVKRDPTWRELGNLLKDLLIACAPRRTIDAAPEYRSMGPMREQTAVAADFEKYLVMMFFRVIAPDRQHVVRDLRTHDTLKLCWVNWETRTYEEAPWDQEQKRYKAFYNPNTRLYYLAVEDVKDQKGNIVDRPLGKEFAWVVFLDASQTKIDKDNAYRVPKIYNPELHSWLYGQEDYSGKWFNWPKLKMGQRKGITTNKWTKQQFHWCGYIDPETGMKAGFRATFKPTHDFVFTQRNGKPYSCSNMCRLYDAIIWRHLGVRSNPHAARSAVTSHFLLQGMDTPEESSLAQLKSHSVKTQSSPHYNKLAALEKTARASEMIVGEFLQERGLDPEQYGLVGGRPYQ
ncbi:MAG: hypothetical protein KME42_08670 [Tildeniella nuda ZEHNDER 1965/U140]|jgi:hypothetical protein|nr:hypothetical protein [Tildeniella nuda ZEHNDER 1965/U140]